MQIVDLACSARLGVADRSILGVASVCNLLLQDVVEIKLLLLLLLLVLLLLLLLLPLLLFCLLLCLLLCFLLLLWFFYYTE